MAQLLRWCRGEGIDPEHVILVKNVPEDTGIDLIEKTLETIKAFGCIRVRERMYDSKYQSLTVLSECSSA